jgi:two-component system, chemotaxis family, chemotaxis protein CheY
MTTNMPSPEGPPVLRVLVVDDSTVMRRMVVKSLEMGGLPVAQVFEADGGLRALEILNEHWVDLVLCDINMPNMNGVELVERMAKDALTAKIPVVMVTTERSEVRIEQLKQLGVTAYLNKPFRPEALAQTVRQLLGLEGAT